MSYYNTLICSFLIHIIYKNCFIKCIKISFYNRCEVLMQISNTSLKFYRYHNETCHITGVMCDLYEGKYSNM